jgi:hypothetical protein
VRAGVREGSDQKGQNQPGSEQEASKEELSLKAGEEKGLSSTKLPHRFTQFIKGGGSKARFSTSPKCSSPSSSSNHPANIQQLPPAKDALQSALRSTKQSTESGNSSDIESKHVGKKKPPKSALKRT